MECVLRIWDTVFAEGGASLLRVAIGLLEIHEGTLLACTEMTDVMMALQSMTKGGIDIELLMSKAFGKTLSAADTDIAELRQRYLHEVEAEDSAMEARGAAAAAKQAARREAAAAAAAERERGTAVCAAEQLSTVEQQGWDIDIPSTSDVSVGVRSDVSVSAAASPASPPPSSFSTTSNPGAVRGGGGQQEPDIMRELQQALDELERARYKRVTVCISVLLSAQVMRLCRVLLVVSPLCRRVLCPIRSFL